MSELKEINVAVDLTAVSSNYFGGVTRYSTNLVTSLILNNKKERIVVFCTEKNFDFLTAELPVHSDIRVVELKEYFLVRVLEFFAFWILPSPTILKIAQFIKYRELIHECSEKFQLIYTPTTYTNFHVKGIVNLVSLHDTQEMKYPNFFSLRERRYRKARVNTTLVTANYVQVSSKFIANEIIEYFPERIDGDRIIVINEGVNLLKYKPLQNRPMRNDIRIIFPGSFLIHKNHEYLFRALSLMPSDTRITVRITGQINELGRDLLVKYEQVASQFVELIGRPSDLQLLREYQEADAVLVCSKYESSSLPILEGLAAGAIALASNIPSHLEMSDDLPIEIFDLEDPSSLVELLMNLNKYDRAGALGISIERYSWDSVACLYLDYFNQLVLENSK